MRTAIYLSVAASAFLLVAGCQATHEQAVQEEQAVPEDPAELAAHCEGIMVSQEEAMRMMSACEIVSIGQPHRGPVVLWKEDGSKLCFVQPQLDWVLIYARTACIERPIQMFIE